LAQTNQFQWHISVKYYLHTSLRGGGCSKHFRRTIQTEW